MDERIQAINVMSKNMDFEFQRNREVLKTLNRYTDEWEQIKEKQAIIDAEDEEIDRKFQELAEEYEERSSKQQTMEEGEVLSIKDLSETAEVQDLLKEVFNDEENLSARSIEPKVILSSRSQKSERKREELLEWMKLKKKEKDKLFRDRRRELIQNEKKPFLQKQPPVNRENDEARKQRITENKQRRIMEADELMESLLREKIPRKKTEKTVKKMEKTEKLTRKDISKKPMKTPDIDQSFREDPDMMSMENLMRPIYEYDPVKQRAVKRVTSVGTLISDEKFHEKLRERKQELMAKEKQEFRNRAIEDEKKRKERLKMIQEAEEEMSKLEHLKEKQEDGEVIQSFEDFLNMQDSQMSAPASTRDTMSKNTITFADDKYFMSSTARQKPKKPSRITKYDGPRVVKTYNQRVAELRVRRDESSKRVKSSKVKVTNRTFTSLKSKEPRRKPMSYVEQLKQLQPQRGILIKHIFFFII